MTLDVTLLPDEGEQDLPAGGFSAWLAMMDGAIAAGSSSDVPCGDCTACCQGAYFIHVAPDETGAIAHIPSELLFPAPGASASPGAGPSPGAGHGLRLLGYDQNGRCPMLQNSSCSVYADRPRTCRTYDCRIFAATGLAEPGREKAAITARAGRWQFDYVDAADRAAHDALRVGAGFMLAQREAFEDLLPGTATQLAMLVVRLHRTLIELAIEHAGAIPARPAVLAAMREAITSVLEQRSVASDT